MEGRREGGLEGRKGRKEGGQREERRKGGLVMFLEHLFC